MQLFLHIEVHALKRRIELSASSSGHSSVLSVLNFYFCDSGFTNCLRSDQKQNKTLRSRGTQCLLTLPVNVKSEV